MVLFSDTVVRAFAVLAITTLGMSAQVVKPKNPLRDGPEVVAAGRTLYNKTCTMCHGPDGAEGDRAPSLNANRRYFRLSEAAIFDAVKNGIAGTAMPACGLPDLDVWRIVAFIRNIRGTASDNIVPGNIENGMTVFTGVGGCTRCHMIRGQGGTIGPDLSSIGAQVTLQKLRDSLTQDGPIPPGYRPVMVTTLTGETIQGIARNEDAFSIQILDEKSKLHLLDKQELRAIVFDKKSLMPRNYDKILSSIQFRDLIAMLSRQARTKVKVEQQGENEIGR
jgi:cytochrome c oxidase cbb3-type subunit 3